MSLRPEAQARGCNYPWLIRFWLFASTFTSVFCLFGYLGECLTWQSYLAWNLPPRPGWSWTCVSPASASWICNYCHVLPCPDYLNIFNSKISTVIKRFHLAPKYLEQIRSRIFLLTLKMMVSVLSTKDIIRRRLRVVSNVSPPISRLVIPFARYKFME